MRSVIYRIIALEFYHMAMFFNKTLMTYADTDGYCLLYTRVGWLQKFCSSLQLQLLQKYVVSYNYCFFFIKQK